MAIRIEEDGSYNRNGATEALARPAQSKVEESLDNADTVIEGGIYISSRGF